MTVIIFFDSTLSRSAITLITLGVGSCHIDRVSSCIPWSSTACLVRSEGPSTPGPTGPLALLAFPGSAWTSQELNEETLKYGTTEAPTKHYTKLNNVIDVNSPSGLITTRSLEISKKITVKLAERIFMLIIGMTLTQLEIPNFLRSTDPTLFYPARP